MEKIFQPVPKEKLEEYKQHISKCVTLMEKLYQSVQIGDTDAFDRYIERIKQECTNIKKKFRQEINYSKILSLPDPTGKFLIHYAVEGGFLDICNKLIENNVSINIGNRQDETPLHIAAKLKYFDICSSLLEKGAILDAKVLYIYLMIFKFFSFIKIFLYFKNLSSFIKFLKTNLQCLFIMLLKMDI